MPRGAYHLCNKTQHRKTDQVWGLLAGRSCLEKRNGSVQMRTEMAPEAWGSMMLGEGGRQAELGKRSWTQHSKVLPWRCRNHSSKAVNPFTHTDFFRQLQ